MTQQKYIDTLEDLVNDLQIEVRYLKKQLEYYEKELSGENEQYYNDPEDL